MNILAGCLIAISFLVCNVFCVNTDYNKVPQRCYEPLFKCWTDCRKYFVCHRGEFIKVACPKGLYWNDEIKACDFHKPTIDCVIPEDSDEEVEPQIPERNGTTPDPVKDNKPTGPPSTDQLKVICYCKHRIFVFCFI